MLIWFYAALAVLGVGALGAWCAGRRDHLAVRWGVSSCCTGAVLALIGALGAFLSDSAGDGPHLILQSPDCLGAFFLLPIAALGFFCAIHAVGYLRGQAPGRLGIFWGFFNLTLAAMICVPLAADPVSFLFFWEMMGTASLILVGFEYHAPETRRATWIYLLAGHAGLFFLIPMFLIYTGIWPVAHPEVALLITGLIGFGLKAGFPLLHVWLPEAHPAAPAPVSALMSGAMINLGFFGILNYAIAPSGPVWAAGCALLLLGVVGAVAGAVSAFAQDNLKRLLACSSVENMGIVALGLGLGFLGLGSGVSTMTYCGFVGAFLHLWNHAALKGALFLCAGEVLRSTGTLSMDQLGGLMKKIPHCGGAFTFAGLSLSALPPFNGFFGEFAIYLAGFAGLASGSIPVFALALLSILALALTGGVVAGVFAKAIGAVFLAEPRSAFAQNATPTPNSVKFALWGMIGLSAVLLALMPFIGLRLTGLVAVLYGCDWKIQLFATEFPLLLKHIAYLMLAGGLIFCIWALLRSMLLKNRQVVSGVTWDCGYAAPSSRMEYTATAIAEFLSSELRLLSRFKAKFHPVRGFFPTTGSAGVKAPDPGNEFLWEPVFKSTARLADKVHLLQSGSLHGYILLMVLAVVAMLIWSFFFFRMPEFPADIPVESAQVEVTK